MVTMVGDIMITIIQDIITMGIILHIIATITDIIIHPITVPAIIPAQDMTDTIIADFQTVLHMVTAQGLPVEIITGNQVELQMIQGIAAGVEFQVDRNQMV